MQFIANWNGTFKDIGMKNNKSSLLQMDSDSTINKEISQQLKKPLDSLTGNGHKINSSIITKKLKNKET
jgi:hypothetical protein